MQKINKQKLINLISFQVLWLSCVSGNNLVALLALLLFYCVHACTLFKGKAEVIFSAAFVAIGFALESLIQNTHLIHFSGAYTMTFASIEFAIIPLWLMCLWLGFSTTVIHGLGFLSDKPWLTIAFCLIGIPWNYFFGAKLSGSSFPTSTGVALTLETIAWSALMLLSLKLAQTYLFTNPDKLERTYA